MHARVAVYDNCRVNVYKITAAMTKFGPENSESTLSIAQCELL